MYPLGKRTIVLGIVLCIAAFALGAFVWRAKTQVDVVAACSTKTKSEKVLCYKKAIEEVVRERGVRSALREVARAYATDPEYPAFCHANTHDLGRAAYARYIAKGAIDLTTDASYCGYGLYHGFMEAMFEETGVLDQARDFCAYVGKNQPVPEGYAEGACYHGIGHGVTEGTDISLRGDAAALAAPGIALCEQVAQTDSFKMRCASGVFNSVAVMYLDPAYGLTVPSDPFTLCRNYSYTNVQKESCYDQMNTLAVRKASNELTKALAFTSTVAKDTYRAIAVKSIAVYYVQVEKAAQRPLVALEVERACSTVPSESIECLRGIISGTLEFGEPAREYEDGLALCGATTTSADFHSRCYRELGTLAPPYYARELQERICAAIPADYRAPCLGTLSKK